MLHGLSFEDYLCCENHYQGYLYSQDVYQLKALYDFLYKEAGRQRLTESRLFPHQGIRTGFRIPLVGKHQTVLRLLFPHFFRAVPQKRPDVDQPELPDLMGAMNAQIRALTGGDVTKEKEVLQMDCWRALTELNAKAHDIQILKSKQNGHK